MFSNGRKVARVVSTIVAMLLLFSMPTVAGFAAVNATSGTNQHVKLAPNTLKGLQAQLGDYLKKDTELRHWKLISQKITPTAQQSSGADVAVVFDVERITRLNYATADDVPAMKGRLAFLKDNANKLSQDELAITNQDIEGFRSDLERYITTDEPCFQRIKVTAALDASGMPLSNTVKFYSEGFLPGQYGLLDLNELPSPQQVEKEAYNGLNDVIKKTKASKRVITSNAYNRSAASNYAYTYTSNTTALCTSNVLQNPYYYNKSYSYWICDDCANYISQAMRYGGVPLSSTWQPYTTAWVNANSLISYMWNRYNLYATYQSSCYPGYPFGLFNSSNVCTHVMMVTYNDGTYVRFSAHTNDRKNYLWSSSLIPSGDHVSWFGVYSYVY